MTEQKQDKYLQRLQELLKEMFQFDSSDLDFGIYNVMKQLKKPIDNFIDNDLKEKIEKIGQNELKKEIKEKELEEAKKDVINTLGNEALDNEGNIIKTFQNTPKGKKYQKLKDEINKLENKESNLKNESEIYEKILIFFNRYYSEGDFVITKKKKGGYLVEGSDTSFSWATKDQYYIKSGNFLSKYSFESDLNENIKSIGFEIIQAEGDNNDKDDKQNKFIFGGTKEIKDEEGNIIETYDDFYIDKENKKLILLFERKKIGTSDYNEKKDKKDKRTDNEKFNDYIIKLVKNNKNLKKINGFENLFKDEGKALKSNYKKWVAKMEKDFFIHKNLKSFLKKELDWYLKNEVYGDILDNSESVIKDKLEQLKVIKEVCEEIINFLATIENFQKKIWEKKPLVKNTEYVFTLDKIFNKKQDKNFILDLISNEQIEEWKELGFIDNNFDKEDVFKNSELGEKYKYLSLDTKHLDKIQKYKLLSSFDNLEEKLNGLLIKSDNFQALNELQKKYAGQVKCIYIDPLYNTGSDGFIYKDSFQHSSWLSMMEDRLRLTYNLLSEDGLFFISIDENEINNLLNLQNKIFGENNFIANIIWDKRNPKGNTKTISSVTEYIVCYAKNKDNINGLYIKKENAQKIIDKAKEIFKKDLSLEEKNKELKKWLKNQDFTQGEKAYSYIDENGKVYRPVSLESPSKGNNIYDITHPNGKKVKKPHNGWRLKKEEMEELIKQGRILFGKDETTIPNRKYLLEENMKTILTDLIHYAGNGIDDVVKLGFKKDVFNNPKPVYLIKKLIEIINKNGIILDFFSGSGTTQQAVIELNKEDGGNRKYIGVEMGEHFDGVIKPRIKKVVYTNKWKDGEPENNDGVNQIFKYEYLEQYEDVLNNISLKNDFSLEEINEIFEPENLESFRDNNISLMSDEKFITNYISNEQSKQYDLVETFNNLIGLNVDNIKYFYDNNNKAGEIITGKDINGNKVQVIWIEKDYKEKFRKEINEKIDKNAKIYCNNEGIIKQGIQYENILTKFRKILFA